MASNRRLLILSCSRSKRDIPGLLPAIERYDGPSFRVLRRFLREQPSAAMQLDVFILSAAYGLISAQQPIPNYNQMMTSQRAFELRKALLDTLGNLCSSKVYSALCLTMSKMYLAALEGWSALVPQEMQITLADGPQGVKLARLQRWLWGNTQDIPSRRQSKMKSHSKACIRGIEVAMTPSQVLEVARKALVDQPRESNRYHSWYVLVGDQRVAPKWLVSQLTGLPVSGFHSQDARRALQQLGLEVHLNGVKEL